jgi:hypothetical protein
MKNSLAAFGLIILAFSGLESTPVHAQESTEPVVLQLVTFSFQPGRMSDAVTIYTEQALPLYQQDAAMLAFRGLREVESPEPLDLIVVSAFRGMAGMDESNSTLRDVAAKAGTSIGGLYGAIGALTTSHYDQFVELLPALTNADPTSHRLVALVSYQLSPGEGPAFERVLEDTILPWEEAGGVPSATGRFLVSDGWNYLRIIGFGSLGDYQRYWARVNAEADYAAISQITVRRKEIVVAPVPELSVR